MKIHYVDQGSPEWHQSRAGVITASMFKVARSKVNCLDARQQAYVDAILRGESGPSAMAIAGYKAQPKAEGIERALRGERVGEYSNEARNYAFRLAIERISGHALQDDQFETYAMRRGHELEPHARAAHERLGVMVARAGFITTDCGRFGASVDGLIHPNGGAEYKCLVSPEGLREILLANDLSAFVDQMQGGIWVGGFDFFHFGLYCPALDAIGQAFTLKLVERDETYIERMAIELEEFDQTVTAYESVLRSGAKVNAETCALLAEEAMAKA